MWAERGGKGRQVGGLGRVWLELDLELCNGHNVNSIKRVLPAATLAPTPSTPPGLGSSRQASHAHPSWITHMIINKT